MRETIEDMDKGIELKRNKIIFSTVEIRISKEKTIKEMGRRNVTERCKKRRWKNKKLSQRTIKKFPKHKQW